MVSAHSYVTGIAAHFDGVGTVQGCTMMAAGHINTTWKITAEGGAFILQRLNEAVFADPEQIMRNAVVLNNALQKAQFPMQWPAFLNAGEKSWFQQEQKLWRLYPFIPAIAPAVCQTAAMAHHTGWAFGCFLKVMATIKPGSIVPVIADFHNLNRRLQALDTAIDENAYNRADQAKALIDQLNSYRQLACAIPHTEQRIVHNDAKLSNLLFADGLSTKPIALIDFDTVMPGLPLYDFGDLVRSCTDAGTEDKAPPSLNKTAMQAVTKGYVQGAGNTLTKAEIESLAFGPAYMTFMLSVRFLSDFLNGDTYFRVTDDKQNLRRAQGQLLRLQNYSDQQAELGDLLASLIEAQLST